MSKPRWKPMDVVYLGNLRHPRGLVLNLYERKPGDWHYTIYSESGGDHHGVSQDWAMARREWLRWFEGFSDEITGREMRELRSAALAPLVEPDSWKGFRARFALTGDPWIREEAPNDSSSATAEAGAVAAMVARRERQRT